MRISTSLGRATNRPGRSLIGTRRLAPAAQDRTCWKRTECRNDPVDCEECVAGEFMEFMEFMEFALLYVLWRGVIVAPAMPYS